MRVAQPTSLTDSRGDAAESESLRLDADLVAALDAFIAQRGSADLSRSAAVNVIVQDWLISQGYLPLPDADAPVVDALTAAEVP
jgi:hypothetical protein